MPVRRALLVDFDGVLRRWPADDAAVEARFSRPAGAIREVAFEPGLLQMVVTGRISDEQWRAATARELQARYPLTRADAAVAAWSEPCGEVNEDVLALVRRVRVAAPVVLVTNATSRLPADLWQLGLEMELDAVINSSEVGIAKPEPGIYAAALDTVRASARDVVYVDDSERNVAAARQLGIHAHCFRDAAEMNAFLRQHGLA